MSAILSAPFIVSAVVGLAALLWCRGLVPLIATAISCGLVWVLA